MITMVIGIVIIVVTAVVSQAARESLLLLAASLGPKIIRRAVAAVPDRRRLIRELEWLAEFQRQLDTGLAFGSLTFALGCLIGAQRIRREAPKEVHNAEERTASPETQPRPLQRLIQQLRVSMKYWREIIQVRRFDGSLAVIGIFWFAALSTLSAIIWIVKLTGRLSAFEVMTGIPLTFIYALSGFKVLEKRVQLRRRSRRRSD